MPRLFVGLPIPEPQRSNLAMLQGGVSGARWVDPANMHLTLRFVGDVDGGMADDLLAALSRLSAPPPMIEVEAVGLFGTRRRPTTLWAGVRRSDELVHLHAKVDRLTVSAGMEPDDRRYTPHVTLARLGANSGRVGEWLEQHVGLALPPWRAEHAVLYESHLGRSGASYRPVAEFPLDAPQPG